MVHEVETKWMGKMQLNALVNGHTIVMDAPEKVGGEDLGPIPKPLMLTALTGCTGMDVLALLRKKGIELIDFDINAKGEISTYTPIQYTAIHIDYLCKGAQEHLEATQEAIRLSQDRYCGVSAMFKKIMPVTWNIYYNSELIESHKAIETHEHY